MSRRSDPAAIVQPTVDAAAMREVRKLHIALRDAERYEEATCDAHQVARQHAAEARLAVGRALVEARKAFPRSGPKAAGWGQALRDAGIEERSARDWMALAGHVEAQISEPVVSGSETLPQRSKEIPTRREVQKARAEKPPAPRVTREAVDEEPGRDETTAADDDEEALASRRASDRYVTGVPAAPTVNIVATVAGAVVIQTSQAQPTTPAELVAAVTGPHLKEIHDHLLAAARGAAALRGAVEVAVREGRIKADWVRSVLRVPLESDVRRFAAPFADAVVAGPCGYCKGTDPECGGCRGALLMTRAEVARVPADVLANPAPHRALGEKAS